MMNRHLGTTGHAPDLDFMWIGHEIDAFIRLQKYSFKRLIFFFNTYLSDFDHVLPPFNGPASDSVGIFKSGNEIEFGCFPGKFNGSEILSVQTSTTELRFA